MTRSPTQVDAISRPRRAARPSVVLALLLAPGCSIAGGGRLQDPTPPPAEQPADAAEPQADAKDQDLPVRRLGRRFRPEARRVREPRAALTFEAGYARFHINASELGMDDEADGLSSRLRFDYRTGNHIGFGLETDGFSSPEDLFEGQTVQSGAGTRPADAEATWREFHPYFMYDPIESARFNLPIRVGPYGHALFLDYDSARIDYQVNTFGVRIGVRPELVLVDGGAVDLLLVGGCDYGIGFTSIDEDLIGRDETYHTQSQQIRANGGLGLRFRGWSLQLGFQWAATGVSLSDVENGRRLPEIDYYTAMFLFGGGVRF